MGGSWNNPTGASIGNIINDRLWNRVFAKARGSGRVAVTRDIITFKFDQGTAEKYKFVALETDTNGDSVLTLMQINDSSQLARCGHNKGYFNCTGRQEWTLRRRS